METVKTQESPLLIPSCEYDDCCTTTDDGSRVCKTTLQRPTAACGCTSEACSCKTISADSIIIKTEQPSTWKRIRGITMFGVACAASPCCTPIIIPIIMTALAGTPLAAWIGGHLGWVYGGLTMLSLLSFIVAWRWMNNPERISR